ncbi:unnamed protein product [Echinostoma caproni]|uniref:PHD-type domain-containing protein n=1 Tax=Echinostoma caproni TaxID=27848 RepID=A0A183BAM2_9TREM|nr:unnamed protein product [Echinostoma caproni]
MLVCDVCDKGFHTYCLRPPVSSIPRNGFKCERCRVCLDCGAGRATFLSGLDSPVELTNLQLPVIKWHGNYTLCDRCFNSRKRPTAICPVCERAWRCSLPVPNYLASSLSGSPSALTWPGKRCTKCRRMVHADCDPSQSVGPSTGSPSSTPSEDANSSSGSGYVCVICRVRGSATPSEVASATASLRASPLPGCGNSSNSGGDLVEESFPAALASTPGMREMILDDVTSRTGLTAPVSMGAGMTGTSWANTPSSCTSNSTTPNTEPGKQQITLPTPQETPLTSTPVTAPTAIPVTTTGGARGASSSPRLHTKSGPLSTRALSTSSLPSRSLETTGSVSASTSGRKRGSSVVSTGYVESSGHKSHNKVSQTSQYVLIAKSSCYCPQPVH